MASRFQAFSTVVAADWKWLSGPVPNVSNVRNQLATFQQSQSIEKHKKLG